MNIQKGSLRFVAYFLFASVFVGFGLSALFQAILGVRLTMLGGKAAFSMPASHLFSTFFLALTGYLSLRWLRLSQPSIVQLKLEKLVPIALGVYALPHLLNFFNGLPFVVYLLRDGTIFLFTLSFWGRAVSSALFGFLLLKLSSNIIDKPDLDWKNLRMASLCLASLGIGIVFEYPLHWLYLTAGFGWPDYSPPWSLLYLFFYLVRMVGTTMVALVELSLSVDILARKRLRGRSVCLAFFFGGLGYIMQSSSDLFNLLPPPSFPFEPTYVPTPFLHVFIRLTYHWIPPALSIIAYILSVFVSASLLRGRKEGKIIKLATIAIFLYAIANLMGLIMIPMRVQGDVHAFYEAAFGNIYLVFLHSELRFVNDLFKGAFGIMIIGIGMYLRSLMPLPKRDSK